MSLDVVCALVAPERAVETVQRLLRSFEIAEMLKTAVLSSPLDHRKSFGENSLRRFGSAGSSIVVRMLVGGDSAARRDAATVIILNKIPAGRLNGFAVPPVEFA